MEITTRRRRALSTALALLLAIESVSAVAAAATVTRTDPASPTAGGATAATAALTARRAARPPAAAAASGRSTTQLAVADSAARGPARSVAAIARPAAFAPRAAVAAVSRPKARTASSHASGTSRASGGGASSGSYRGANHFWLPAIGISRPVYSYACSRKTALANLVYRWGCAGSNNVYVMGHAWGVFKPLHDAYVRGRLRVGMKAYYADGSGRTHTYTIRWWKLTRPTTAASWAWASQSRPSMTLQTCIGAHSEYRLMVRLVEVR
jgi:hypothetical protein